ncbi:PNPH phosphorylase, partial [Paradoxornis webbianus]|nr:PNPH phosphorylase [Sinosuthora webbiana]
SYEACAEAAAWLRARLREPPRVALVCGSGLGALAQELRDPQSFDYAEIPHFPRSTVQGHAGRLVVGRLGSAPCAVLQGRFHLYEGYSPAQVVVPVRTLALAGVHTLVLTNAAGSLQPHLGPGHLLVIRDHIDLAGLAGRSPLVGPNDDRWAGPEGAGFGGKGFGGMKGDCFVKEYKKDFFWGGKGEFWAARHLGLRVLGLSLITNSAPGDDECDDDGGDDVMAGGAGPATPTGHAEVLAAAQEGARHLRALLVALAPKLDEPGRS